MSNCRVLLLLLAVVLLSFHGGAGEELRWQIITKLNYSSYIRLNPNVFLLVTVPWCGESRSIMKELSHAVASDQASFGTLKLIVLYRNVERILADALGAAEGITMIYYHHTISCKYGGKFRVQNILSSVHYVISLSSAELPLKSLTTSEELRDFLDSTDKAVLLFEFCGWVPKLLSKDNNTAINDPVRGYPGADFHIENNETFAAIEKDNRKGFGDGFSEFSLLSQFTSFNNSLIKDAENMTFTGGFSCSLDELRNFELFLQKFITVAREFFLPRERHRFALIHDKSLLPLLNVEESGSWFITVHSAGCCSTILQEGDDLRTVLQTQISPVLELENDSNGYEATLPANKPTILLFIDRSSNSTQIKIDSQRAIHSFRQLAQHYQVSNHMHGQANNRPASLNTHKHPKPSKKLILNNKMSVTIINEGQQVTLEDLVTDLQGSSMQEILTYALAKKNELKLSSLAKSAGFQLLSNDFDIQVAESNDILLEGKKDSSDKSSELHVKSDDHVDVTTDGGDQGGISENDDNEQIIDFNSSFFFFDGQYRLLETLTGESKIPSVVIIDPISDQHYVLPVQSNHSYNLLFDFVNNFLSGNLLPYQQSDLTVRTPKEIPRPPFVNLDFHEMDSIPLVTARNFVDLVLGNNSDQNNNYYSGGRNTLVLFSNSWCGFCQRTELVVREVYRAIKGYRNLKMNSSNKKESMLKGENVEDALLKLPLIYMMDCTKNDCGLIVKPILQREVYPLLLLFPAERKNETVVYEGNTSVSDIIKFLASHGSHVTDIIIEKGYIQQEPYSVQQGWTLHHEVLLQDRLIQNVAVDEQNQIITQFPIKRPQLSIGSILTATEKLIEVHPFDESKILLVKVEESARFQGLIINKHIGWEDEFLEPWFDLLKEAPLSFGGPVMRRGMPLVALTKKFIENESIEVLPDVYFIDPQGTHNLIEEIRVGNRSVDDYWFFLGYSNWGWDQLFHEIDQGAWNVSDGDLEQLEGQWRGDGEKGEIVV